MTIARSYLGVRETPGPANNPTIMGWAKKLGAKVLGIAYTDDSATAWCGLFCAEVMTEAGFKPPPIAVRAKSWATWGDPGPAGVGAILVFQRPGGGHVGLCAAETLTAYQVLGGNQGDAVSLALVAKDRCIAVRWPPGVAPSPSLMVADTGPRSHNEA